MRDSLLRLLFQLLRLGRPRIQSTAPVFLVLQYRTPLGCCVHGTPVYAALKDAHPDCTIIVSTQGLGYAVLQNDPHIDHLLDTPDPGTSLRDLCRHAQQLREQLRHRNLKPNQILQDASNRRGTLALFALLLRLAPTRGFANLAALYDEHLNYDPGISLIDNNLRLVGTDTLHWEPSVYFTADDLKAAQSLLSSANPRNQPLTAVVVQGSGAQPNNWHDDRFATLIRHVKSTGHRIVFLGTSAESGAIDRISALSATQAESLAGRTTVPQLAALLCLCDTLITVDTGTLHVGRAAHVPLIVLAPSWQPAIEWLPFTVPNAIVLRGTDISSIPANYKVDEITVEAAIAAFDQLSTQYPPSATAREQRVARLLSHTRA
jgi:ADP-heptose:LPS heptosyltransferase